MNRLRISVLLFTLLSFCDCQDARPRVNEPGFTCTPGKVFKDDCNTCSCDNSGTLARCTAMACPPEERSKRAIAEEPCMPGDIKMNACNRCRCTATKIWACTRKACPDAVEEVEDMNNYDNHQKLKRSAEDYQVLQVDVFEIDDRESKSASLDTPCVPNQSFKLECNTCWCRADGQGPKYCTRIACHPKTYKPLDQSAEFPLQY